MKIILVLMFLVAPGQPPQVLNLQVETLAECFEQASAFLNTERAQSAYVAIAGCRLEKDGRDVKQ